MLPSLILALALATPAGAAPSPSPSPAPADAPTTEANPAPAPGAGTAPGPAGAAPDASATATGSTSAAPATPSVALPAGTPVALELAEEVSSETHERGDFFALALAEPLVLDGRELVPAGTPVVGQVVHAAKAGGSGKAGELILAARYVDWQGRQLPLRAFRAGNGTGQARSGAAMGVGMVVPLGNFLVRGRARVMPAGSRVEAKLSQAEGFFPLP